MKSSRHDKTKGTFHEVRGKVRQAAGTLTDNPELQDRGEVEKIGGKLQKKLGQVKKKLGQ